jgi:hypothetical protein
MLFRSKAEAQEFHTRRRARALRLVDRVSHVAGEFYTVRSESGSDSYIVDTTRQVCNCPDWANHNTVTEPLMERAHCKHMQAVELFAQGEISCT